MGNYIAFGVLQVKTNKENETKSEGFLAYIST